MVEYFAALFTSFVPIGAQEICLVVRGKLNQEHVNWCQQSFTNAEVKEVLFQMDPLKAPGPESLLALFFQKYWHTVGPDIYSAILDILNNKKDPRDINNTHIVMILKCKKPSSPKDFRPINLCNVVMMIVTKTIANRIKHILPDIIGEEKRAFVKGRIITDNALVVMECFHWMKKKKKGKCGVMAIKLDMSKAYDYLE